MNSTIRVNTAIPKESIKSRVDCASTMSVQAPQSAFFPTVKDACNDVIAEGVKLAAAEATVNNALATLANAREERDSALVRFDNALNALVSDVEKHATKPAEVTSLALTVFERQSYALEAPSGLTVRFDAAKNVIRVLVELPPGAASCLLEVSTDPTAPGSWKRVTGDGARRALAGYAPGTYWFRASSVRANDESEATTPVSVMVK
jgi:hypothetical protein